jgi:hypothetical protein
MFFIVNGYGATPDIEDRNYTHYLSEVLRHTERDGHEPRKIILCGGCTNRADLSEAETMRRWIDGHFPYWSDRLVLCDDTFTAQENFRRVSEWFDRTDVFKAFGEYSRRRTLRLFAWRYFNNCEVIGVRFDDRSLRPVHRFKQLFLHLPLETLALYLPPFNWLRLFFRRRHVARVRSQAQDP